MVELQKIYHSHLDAPNFLVTKPLSEFDILWSFSSQDIKSLGDLGGFRIFWIYYSQKHQRSETHLTTFLKLIPYNTYLIHIFYLIPSSHDLGKFHPFLRLKAQQEGLRPEWRCLVYLKYTHMSAYIINLHIFSCVYIYTNLNWWVSLPEFWSINSLPEFLWEKDEIRQMLDRFFFPGFPTSLKKVGQICLECWLFSPCRSRSFWSNSELPCQVACESREIACGVRWFGNSHFYIVMYCN